jgi:pimeloyl-ACP methyl ester carboxylesterase
MRRMGQDSTYAGMQRREVLRGTAMLVATGAAYTAAGSLTGGRIVTTAQAQGDKKTYVLVHGAWHGGWCWKRVTPLLRAAGHEVYTPTLTGLGDRAHLGGMDSNLDIHIQDVLMTIQAEELSDIILVGHSYAGMVVTGVADRIPSLIKHLVYLDAFVPENGKSLLDYAAPERQAGLIKVGRETGYVTSLPMHLLGVTNLEDVAWVSRRLVKQSFQTFSQSVRLFNVGEHKFPRTYIYCSNPPTGAFDQFANAIKNNPKWTFHEMKTGHDAMITDPEGLTKILLGVA